MTRESYFYKILSAIHVVFFTSLLSLGCILFSGTLLLLPVLGAVFFIGKDVLYKKLDITDSIIKTFCHYLKGSLVLLRFLLVQIVLILDLVGLMASVKSNNLFYGVLCLSFVAFLLTMLLYVAGFHVFVCKKFTIVDVILCMLMKPQLLFVIFIVMIFSVYFFSNTLFFILLFCGAFILFALEVVIFIQILYYKEMLGVLDEEDEFRYLVNRKVRKR